MQELKCPNTAAYLDLLNQSGALRQECERRMSVPISRFFRDCKLWQGLEEEILPGLIETGKTPIRVWSAGCARGEEVYSFKIVWDRFKEKFRHQARVAVTATDVNPHLIKQAWAGVYTRSSLERLSE